MSSRWPQQVPSVVSASRQVRETPSEVLASVSTILTADERLRVDAVGMGMFRSCHRDSIDDVVRDLRQHRTDAVLISTTMCRYTDAARVARVVREFPRVPAVALVSQFDGHAARAVLLLGQCGVRTLVDVREPTGWRELRSVLLKERASDIQRLAIALVADDLTNAPKGAVRFFEILFSEAPHLATVRELSRTMGLVPSTLMSRFYRAQLPPLKRYLAVARLMFAARLFENPGVSIANVANQLDYSSPQSFSRHVRSMLKLTAVDFRLRYNGEGVLALLRNELVLAHRSQWAGFDPFKAPKESLPLGTNCGNSASGSTYGKTDSPTPALVPRVADGP